MRKLLISFAGFLAAFAALAGDTRGVSIERSIVDLAQALQARLPGLAVDGMLEAERETHGWTFSIRVRSEKGGADDMQVIIREVDATHSDLRVQAVRVEQSLLTSKRSVNPALNAEWNEKILRLVERAQ